MHGLMREGCREAALYSTHWLCTTMRIFLPIDLAPYPHIKTYLRRIGERKAYQRAMRKGDPDLVPLLT